MILLKRQLLHIRTLFIMILLKKTPSTYLYPPHYDIIEDTFGTLQLFKLK